MNKLTLSLIELILEYGPTAAISLIKTLNTENPTPEQIRALKVKHPNEYIKDKS